MTRDTRFVFPKDDHNNRYPLPQVTLFHREVGGI